MVACNRARQRAANLPVVGRGMGSVHVGFQYMLMGSGRLNK